MEGVGQADPKNTAAGNSPGARYRDPLLAVEGMVPENQVRQREASPSLFSSRAGILKPSGTCVGDPGTSEKDSQRRNDPEEGQDQDQKTFRPVSVLEVHGRHPPPEWIPFQEV